MFSAAVFVKDCDVAAFAISTIDDPRTLNKVLYLRPPGNIVSMNQLAEMWEAKIGKKLEKVYIPEEQLLKSIQGTCIKNVRMCLCCSLISEFRMCTCFCEAQVI